MIILDQAPELILPAHYRDARPAIIRPGVNPETFFPVQWDRKERRAFVSDLVKIGRVDRDDAVKIATAIPFGMFKPIAAGGVPFGITYVGTATDASNLTTYDFGSFSIPNDGYVIVGVVSEAGAARTISSVSIGGTNGTIYAQYDTTNWVPHGFAYRSVTAGSQNITVVFSAGMSRAAIAVWVITTSTQTAPNAGANAAWAAGVTSRAPSFNIPTNGVAAYICYRATASNTTWSSATEQGDVAVETSHQFSFADKTVTTAITPHTETASFSSSTATACGISWGP